MLSHAYGSKTSGCNRYLTFDGVKLSNAYLSTNSVKYVSHKAGCRSN